MASGQLVLDDLIRGASMAVHVVTAQIAGRIEQLGSDSKESLRE